MSESCENNTLLKRDGTSQRRRLLKALLPDYAAIDDRGIADLIEFAKAYGKELRYFSENGSEHESDWGGFLSTEKDKDLNLFLERLLDDDAAFKAYAEKKGGFTQPQKALFLAFLKLFRIAQDDLNKIGKKHIDFYYRDVLRLKENPPVADKVHLIFELARHVRRSHRIAEGTELKAGKDKTGQPLTYATKKELAVNHGKVKELKAVFRDSSSDDRLYASPVVNSSDGKGGEIENEEKSWKSFGSVKSPFAEIGCAIASPLLSLPEGNRKVIFSFLFDPSNRDDLERIARMGGSHAGNMFRVLFSGEEGWIETTPVDRSADTETESEVEKKALTFINSATVNDITVKIKDDPSRGYSGDRPGYTIGPLVAGRIVEYRTVKMKGAFSKLDQVLAVRGLGQDKLGDIRYTFTKKLNRVKINPAEGSITIARTLNESDPPVVNYDKEVLSDPIETQWPVAKIMLNMDAETPGNFPYQHLKNLKLLDAKVSVDVEGIRNNILQNDAGLLDPGKPFMPFGNRPATGSSFYIGNRDLLQKKPDKVWIHFNWQNLPSEGFEEYYREYGSEFTFNTADFKATLSLLQGRRWEELNDEVPLFMRDDNGGQVLSQRSIALTETDLAPLRRNAFMEQLTSLGTSTKDGFLRLELGSQDFGHKDYAKVYAYNVINEVVDEDSEDNIILIPNEPYTPVIAGLSIDYKASVVLGNENMVNSGIDQYFLVHPFGVTPAASDKKHGAFVPAIEDEGSLYIGMKDFSGGQTLSLLIQVAEGSADPDFPRQPVYWSFLSGDNWAPFNDRQVLSDTTNELLTSGIISFSVPGTATTEHTMLPAGFVWLRASAAKQTPAISDLISIQAQAVTAEFRDRDNDPEHLASPLPAETIAKLKSSDSSVREVNQPFASFGGAMKEESEAYYVRVSERLRHKQRAVTIWDYERLILQKFPSVYKVKCLNHIRYEGPAGVYSEIAPGYVSLIVVSDMKNRNAVDPLKPKTSLALLSEIEDYLSGIRAEAVKLTVRNPLYEEIKVSFNVSFREGMDQGFYAEVLNREITSYLSPWAFEDTPDVVFGGRIHKSMILHFVEKRPYVDFVTCFKMDHRIPSGTGEAMKIKKDVDEAEASTSASVLGSAPAHNIKVLDEPECACDDNKVEAFKELKTDDCGCS